MKTRDEYYYHVPQGNKQPKMELLGKDLLEAIYKYNQILESTQKIDLPRIDRVELQSGQNQNIHDILDNLNQQPGAQIEFIIEPDSFHPDTPPDDEAYMAVCTLPEHLPFSRQTRHWPWAECTIACSAKA